MPKTIYQIKISLRYSKPPIWRRVLLPAATHLDKLHQIIQIVMDWEGYHLHHFATPGRGFNRFFSTAEMIQNGMMDDMEDESQFQLQDFLRQEKDKLDYVYDFGDDWEHVIMLEKILASDPKIQYPCCSSGRRAAPPEDIGGIPGYEHLLNVLEQPDHPEYEELTEWLADDFDPKVWDQQALNQQLHEQR
ncbi:plasmid pRiA4b ORF-3 family protein [Candidatus Venteria ishoeyi]|uniref:plasmid pRiA4b ORF-3 family protein n=1 Tax=Candidatus Venteria ishoeyi TaxID=1899563 RepID=UPI0025A5136E|nr:plasmid pRiA4b ORF-3 family protein [Candidatus Venteria ishoeyi]MDM8546841.1 plasmid pRiA4b ORF-3 family protein [Candidatus Venteria ishoeyi]